MAFQSQRGTHDITPQESPKWQWLERTFLELVERYGYAEIRTPIFEDTELFLRTSGETSEVVSKQMYSFEDRGGRSLTLKPEGTAPVMRAYLEHHLGQPGQTTRLCYVASPTFRYERPQKGRYRQHHQLGCELIGSGAPAADAEIIEIAYRMVEKLGATGLVVKLNSIGRSVTRTKYRDALVAFAQPVLDSMEPEARELALKNPLRMLDTKDPERIKFFADAPKIVDFLEESSREHFNSLQALLHEAGIPFQIAPEIVRGLDYYTDTVFEVHSESLGAQTAVCAGGRYDGLIKEIGGPQTPSVGFGMGMERALIVREAHVSESEAARTGYFLVAATPSAWPAVRQLTRELRSHGHQANFDLDEGSIKSQFKKADHANAVTAIVIGDDELASGSLTIKNLGSGEQSTVLRSEFFIDEPKERVVGTW